MARNSDSTEEITKREGNEGRRLHDVFREMLDVSCLLGDAGLSESETDYFSEIERHLYSY